MIRMLMSCVKYLGRRRTAILVPLLIWGCLMAVTVSWLGETSRALRPPPPPDQNLHHFRRTRDLRHYLDNTQLLIEPSSACEEEVPVVILVSSAPSHARHRQAIRTTWGRLQPTYFLLGLDGQRVDEALADTYVEAKQFSDLIVYDFPDHYQNLTLKTALMLQWTLARCRSARYLFKTDDDVVVNPWTLAVVLEEHYGARLLGYRITNSSLHRDEYTKWFVPRWLVGRDRVPEYLSGTGYLINVNYIQKILDAAKKVPLINLEDVYLTYLVCNSRLNLDLVHDRRLSPYKPWVPSSCAYWALASSHSHSPEDIAHAWAKIEGVAKQFEKDSGVCSIYKKYVENEILLS